MPVAKKKVPPVQPIAPAPPPVQEEAKPAPIWVPEEQPKEVIYPELQMDEYSTASKKGPLDPEWCKIALGWETESEYKKRRCEEVPGSQPKNWEYKDNEYHCKNVAGEKVRCRNNAQNRPFDNDWGGGTHVKGVFQGGALVQTILRGQWAGPHTITETKQEVYGGDDPYTMNDGRVLNKGDKFRASVGSVNGETVRIDKYGFVLSGQHQMTACILADELLAQDRKTGVDNPTTPKYPTWAGHDHVFIETVVIKGMSDDSRILMTVDYVKPRTSADVFYTSEVFKSASSPERKVLCDMLANAVDTLWSRTGARGYKTHPEIVGFLERHKKLLECTLHLFEENKTREGKGRGISKLRLQPGICSAIMFIQASSGPKTDGDVYRNEEPAPSEKNLDWSMWDKADSFWTLLANTTPAGKDFQQVRTAFHNLIDSEVFSDDNMGLGGNSKEKLAILCEAWGRWKDHPDTAGPPFDDGDLGEDGILSLVYSEFDDAGNPLPKGQIKLVNQADFNGIDWTESAGEVGSTKNAKMAPPPTKEQIEKGLEEIHKQRAQQLR